MDINAERKFFCHGCNSYLNGNQVSEVEETAELVCQLCRLSCIEEVESAAATDGSADAGSGVQNVVQSEQAQQRQPHRPRRPRQFRNPFLNLEESYGTHSQFVQFLVVNSAPNADNGNATGNEGNPFDFSANEMRAEYGSQAPFLVILQNTAVLGDYAFGGEQEFQQLIERIMQSDPNHFGTPPAAESAIKELPRTTIDASTIHKFQGDVCVVCHEQWTEGKQVVTMPCKHSFDEECLLPWLEIHNSCPTCRYEIRSANSEYNRKKGVSTPPQTEQPHTDTTMAE